MNSLQNHTFQNKIKVLIDIDENKIRKQFL